VIDQQNVHLVTVIRGNGGLEKRVSFFSGNFRPDPFQAASDPVNVRVDRKNRHLEGKQQEASDGLGADTFEAAEIRGGLLGRETFEKFEGNAASLLAKLAEDDLDAWSLDAGKTGGANPTLDFFHRSVGDFVPCPETTTKLAISSSGVLITGVLRKDRFDQHVNATAPLFGGTWTVAFSQSLPNFVDVMWMKGHG